jgi:hypothetical protein
MRKIKTLLMIMVLGMLFISCDNEVTVNPSVDVEDLELLYNATDTIQVVAVTEQDKVTYYDVSTDRPVPMLRVLLDVPIKILIVCLFTLIGFGIGAAVFGD